MRNVPMRLPELIPAEHEMTCGHSSTFVELDDGRIFHVAGGWKNHSEDGGRQPDTGLRRDQSQRGQGAGEQPVSERGL